MPEKGYGRQHARNHLAIIETIPPDGKRQKSAFRARAAAVACGQTRAELEGATVLHILGSRTRLCDGITRREALRAGGLGLFGLSLPQLLAAESAPAPASPTAGFGKAKRCILLYLYGAPSQLET